VALLRQAPNNGTSITPMTEKAYRHMGLTHNDANIFAYQFKTERTAAIKGPAGDQYLYPHTQVDAQVSYWIPRAHGVQAIVSMLNLNNEVLVLQRQRAVPVQRNTTAARSHWECGGHRHGSRNSLVVTGCSLA